MRKIIKFCCVVVLVAFLVGCKSSASSLPSPSTTETTTREVEVVLRDTTLKTEKDSSFYKAWIDCVNGKPVLKNPESKNGRKLQAPNVNLKGNELQVDCRKQAEELFHQWKETYIKESKLKETRVPYAVPTPLTQFQIVQLLAGRFFLLLLLLLLIAAILRFKKVI
jgi:hypothetical protein